MGSPASLDATRASQPRAREPARGSGGSRDHRDVRARVASAAARASGGLAAGDRVVKGSEIITVAGREVAVSNPGKVLFPEAGHTKLDLVEYYLAVAEGALQGAGGRPNVLVRYPNGVGGEFFFQKRAPESRPDWIEVVSLQISVRPHRRGSRPARRGGAGLDGESRLPGAAPAPGARRGPRSSRRAARRPRSRARRRMGAGADVAEVVRASLGEFGLVGWPKTSGSRGMHVYVRIERRWAFDEVRRAALALRARSRATGAGLRHQQVVEGGAARRLPRLQPERQGPHDRGRVFRAAHTRCARLGAARLGRGRRLRPRAISPWRACRRDSRRSAIRTPA